MWGEGWPQFSRRNILNEMIHTQHTATPFSLHFFSLSLDRRTFFLLHFAHFSDSAFTFIIARTTLFYVFVYFFLAFFFFFMNASSILLGANT